MNKKLKKFALIFTPTVIALGSSAGILTSCAKKATSNFVDVKLVNDENFELTNTTAKKGSAFNTTIQLIDPEADKYLIINDLYLFSNGNQLERGDEIDGDYQFTISDDKKSASLTVYNPKETIYVAIDTSLYETDISFNTSNKVHVYANDSVGQKDGEDFFIFNFNNATLPDNSYIQKAVIETVVPDEGYDTQFFDNYLRLETGSFLVDPYTNTFKVGIYCNASAHDVGNDWSGKVSFKFEYSVNGISQTRFLHNIPVSYTNSTKYQVEMNEDDAEVEIYRETATATYTMKLNEDSIPLGSYASVKLNKSTESVEDIGEFYLVNSLVPVLENANGDKTISVSIAYRLDADKTFDRDQNLYFDFNVSYINSSYESVTETAKYHGKDGKPNVLNLKNLARALVKYRTTSQYVADSSQAAIYEFECAAYSPAEIANLTFQVYETDEYGRPYITTVSDKLFVEKENVDVWTTPDNKIILKVPVKVKPEVKDSIYNYTFVLKISGYDVDPVTEEQKPFTVKWIGGSDEPVEHPTEEQKNVYSFPLFYTRAKSIDPGDFAMTNNEITGLAPSGLEKLSSTPENFDSLVIPYEINGVKVHAIGNDAFKYSSNSGKAILAWAKKRIEKAGSAPVLVFETPSDEADWRLTRIGTSAFEGQNYFTGDLIIPGSVLSIDDCAFKDCNKTKDGGYGFTGLQFGTYDVDYELNASTKKYTVKFDVHSKLNWIGKQAFYNSKETAYSSYRGNLILPNSLAALGDNCFKNAGFDGLLHFSSSYSWHEASNSAFEGCVHLKGVCEQDFYPNTSSTYAVIPSFFFKNCSSFSGTYSAEYDGSTLSEVRWVPSNEVIINEAIQSVGESAFEATAIQSLIIKANKNNGQISINKHAFNKCSLLSHIEIFTSKDQGFDGDNWDGSAFDGAGVNSPDGKQILIDSIDAVDHKISDPVTYVWYVDVLSILVGKYQKSGKLNDFEWVQVAQYDQPVESTLSSTTKW